MYPLNVRSIITGYCTVGLARDCKLVSNHLVSNAQLRVYSLFPLIRDGMGCNGWNNLSSSGLRRGENNNVVCMSEGNCVV